MPGDGLNVSHGHTSVMHLGESGALKAMSTDTLQPYPIASQPENLVSAGFVDVPATMPTGEQVFLCQVKLIGFQVALEFRVNLDFSLVSCLPLVLMLRNKILSLIPLTPITSDVSRVQASLIRQAV